MAKPKTPSMTTQAFLLQREVTPGAEVTDSMNRVLGIKGIPGWSVEGSDFKASGSKVNTSRTTNTETGTIAVETLQDYNAAVYNFTGGFGAPISSNPVDNGGTPSTVAFEHTFELKAMEPDDLITFTGVWGDSDEAVLLRHLYFNSMGITINRGGLSFETSAASQAPEVGFTLPTEGVTSISSVPVSSRSWDGYFDDSWAALGTTQLLALYEGGLTFGDKYTPDYKVNSAQPSFDSVIEADSTDYAGNLRVGYDAVARSMVESSRDGDIRFVRFLSTGPVIENTTTYLIEMDLCVRIINPGSFEAAPNSAARTLPFDFQLTVDPVTDNTARARIVNTVPSL